MEKFKGNPVVTPEQVKPSLDGYEVHGAFNPGATVFNDEILLLLRVAEACKPKEGVVRTPVYRFENEKSFPDIMEFSANDPDVFLKDTRGVVYKGQDYLSTMSHIRIARSTDGLNFTVDEEPFIFPVNKTEKYGIEDARVTLIDGLYHLNFTVISGDSWATTLAVTKDFKTIERKGIIFHPENKDVAIFPEKVGGKYIALHRPNNSGFGKASIWYAESPDLLHWGNHKCIVRPRDIHWESMKIGGGAPPIKTDDGWLIIYHGKGDNSRYSLFALLLDLNDPSKIIKRAAEPFLVPDKPYETEGFFPNVVFSNGVVEKDGKLYIYYGAADESSCVAIADIDSIMETL
ncbi:MAG: glycoside hydrolase family 130 protein [Kiritimatiellae bacterium]|nr:glycoside hydrolase family 130 protein [Kiritimatiellia bacterium]